MSKHLGTILLPPIAPIPQLPTTLAGLLPNRNHNEDLYQALENTTPFRKSADVTRANDALPRDDGEQRFTNIQFQSCSSAITEGGSLGEAPAGSLVGILAADPFLHVQRLAKRLRAASFSHVVNLPSVTQYGHDALASMDRLGLGPQRELEILQRFAALGFQLSFTLTHHEQIPIALGLKPTNIIIAPRFDTLINGQPDQESLMGLYSATKEACLQDGDQAIWVGMLHDAHQASTA